MENTVIYIVLIANTFCSAVVVSNFRKRVIEKKQEESVAKNTYTLTAIYIGIIFSLFGYYVVSRIYRYLEIAASYGHGEEALSFFLSLLVNLLLTVFIVIIGRSLIGWNPVRW